MKQKELVEEVKQFINTHYMENTVNISTVAIALERNPKYIARVFRSETGEGMLEYIHRLRIMQAIQLFHSGHNSVNEVGVQVGYATYKSFLRAFIKGIGVTPGNYLNSI